MKIPEDYQVPDEPDAGRMDAAYLRSCLGLRAKPGEEPPPLPTSVRQAHYKMARCLSVLGVLNKTMTPTQLATVVMMAGEEPQEPEPEAYSFLVGLTPIPGEKVVIHWRGKDRPAHFLNVTTEGRVLVLHEGKEVKMRPDLVRRPKRDEFPEVPDNINQTVEV